MKRINSLFAVVSLCMGMLALGACSKNDEGSQENPVMAGKIYHHYTSQVMQIDTRSWVESNAFSYNAYSTVGWSISRDGKYRLMSTREPGTYDRNRFRIINTANGQVEREFDFVPRFGNYTNNVGYISFDNTRILVNPDRDNGIVILDMEGNVLHELTGIGDDDFTMDDEAYWLPNNSLLVRFQDKYLLRSDPPYSDLQLVKELNYEKWGGVRVSNSGQKISLYINQHIHMMDIDGSNFVQVTDGNQDEAFAEFSPDDKYLLVGADYFHAPASQNSHWYLKIIPADGKTYNMESSPEVIEVIPQGSSSVVRANGVTIWRP